MFIPPGHFQSFGPTRRSVLSGLIAAPAVLSLAQRVDAKSDLDVAIIGAGAAGIAAAHSARALGLTARIFEARSRVGGRVHTETALGTAYDAGAFYIHWAERNPWMEIAKAEGAELVDDNTLYGGFDVFRYGQSIPLTERLQRRGAFGRLSTAIDAEGSAEDLSFAAAAQRYAPELMEAANGMTLLSLGEEAERVSIRDYQQLDGGDDFVLPDGYGTLLVRHARSLDVALSTPVRAIDLSGAGVRLETSAGVVTSRAVVLTVSVGVLKAGGIRITPRLPDDVLAALDGLQMGALTKVALRFRGETFGLSPWTQYFDQGNGRDLVNFEFWPFGRDLVIAFFGGDYARGLAAAGEAAAVAALRERLVAILGSKVGAAFVGGHLAGWSADPYALGGYSIVKPGHVRARVVLEAPIHDRLYLAGEANAGAGSMTAGGAALAGRRAVEEIAKRLASGAIAGD